ncbi:MAG: excalibur calcium-binding domain-containing protein [Thermoanaerobaculia bacterium]
MANKFAHRGGIGCQLILVPLLLAIWAASCSGPPPTRGHKCNCTANLYDCRAFPTHYEAQACFEYCQDLGVGDIHRLDRDHDGIACEWNP